MENLATMMLPTTKVSIFEEGNMNDVSIVKLPRSLEEELNSGRLEKTRASEGNFNEARIDEWEDGSEGMPIPLEIPTSY